MSNLKDLTGWKMKEPSDVVKTATGLLLVFVVPVGIFAYVTDQIEIASLLLNGVLTTALVLIYWYMATTSDAQQVVADRQADVAERHAVIAEEQTRLMEKQAELLEKQVDIDEQMRRIVESEHIPHLIPTDVSNAGGELVIEFENAGTGYALDIRVTCELLVSDEDFEGVAVPLEEHRNLQLERPSDVDSLTHDMVGPPFSSITVPLNKKDEFKSEDVDNGVWKSQERGEGASIAPAEQDTLTARILFNNSGGEADSKYTPIGLVTSYLYENGYDKAVLRVTVHYDDIVPGSDSHEKTILHKVADLEESTDSSSFFGENKYEYDPQSGGIHSPEDYERLN